MFSFFKVLICIDFENIFIQKLFIEFLVEGVYMVGIVYDVLLRVGVIYMDNLNEKYVFVL